MRWLVVFFVMINIAVFAWYQFLMPANSSKGSAVVVTAEAVSPFKLLSEMSEQDREMLLRGGASQSDSEGGAQLVKISEAKPQCWIAGPFVDAGQGSAFARDLKNRNIQADLKQVLFDGEKMHMVYLEPLATEVDARVKLKGLHDEGKESFLITHGKLKNGISVGVFSDESKARLLYNEYKAGGYDAVMTMKSRKVSELWAAIPPKSYQQMDENQWFSLLSSYQGVDKRQNFCDVVASYPNID